MSEKKRVTIEPPDQEGRGGAHADGKVIFIEGRQTGETVSYSSYRKKPSFEQAQVTQIHKQSSMRVQPRCKHFGVCGGCSMQHLEAGAQVAVKQRILEDSLWHIGRVKAETMLPPIHGQTGGYRERARFSVRHVIQKGKTLVGFHEKRSSFVADMQSCEILTPKIAALIPLLAELIVGLALRDKLPQLSYSLPEFGITRPFAPSEFTQVNSALNRVMVSRAVRLLDPQPGERIADFFCGLGNFTLPIAGRGAQE